MIRPIDPGPLCATCYQPAILRIDAGYRRTSRPTCTSCGAALPAVPLAPPVPETPIETTAPTGPESFQRALRAIDEGAHILGELREDYLRRMRELTDARDASAATLLAMEIAALRDPLADRLEAMGNFHDDCREASNMLEKFATPAPEPSREPEPPPPTPRTAASPAS
jgi:hypothetical protein